MGNSSIANATDPELHKPPVRTKTWYHTGAWEAGAKISKQYEHEYFKGDPKAVLLPDTRLPYGLTPEEEREACRALKGQVLRQEIYAQDGTEAEERPYLVSERSYDVRRVQPMVRTPAQGLGTAPKVTHGVFFAHPREALETHYERTLDDPRITHAMTLAVDDLGVVTRSAAIGYPRRLAHAEFAEQGKVTITSTEVDVFHHAPRATSDWYRIGVPLGTKTYELTGILPAADAVFSFDAVKAAVAGAIEIAYEQAPNGSSQKRLLSHTKTLYLKNDLSGPLAPGDVASLALPYESYGKAFTPALLASALGGRATDAILLEGGYVRFPGDDAWWVPSGRQDVSPSEFYLPVSFTSPFGKTTTVAYDQAYHLIATQVTDPLGNTVTAQYDLRTLAPWQVTDPNGNRAQARFDALGMVIATAVMGKPGDTDGDTLDDPTTTFEYDLDQYRTTGKPNFAHGRAREKHGPANVRWQESYSYSDGSGREVMRKVQAEPGKAPERGSDGALVHDINGALVFTTADPRWVGTGRTVFDNKGNPVKQYEPFFSGSPDYEDETELAEWGVTPILRYDPLGRLVRTDLPNGTFSKVEFGPWKETRFDPNDTVLESAWYASRQALDAVNDPEGRAAYNTAAHAQTPAVVHLDALGRPFRAIEDNGVGGQFATTTTLDIEGNPRVITDARGVDVQTSVFGMGGAKLSQESCDAGKRWMLADIGGALLRAWDERGFVRRAKYDDLRRPTHLLVQPATGNEFLAERTVYGEALGASAETLNLRGKPYQHYDGAGVVTSLLVDFKGNLLQSERRLAKAYATQVDWTALDGLDDPAVIASAAHALLEAEVFAAQTEYDALNRPVAMFTPDASEIRPTYNEAGLLEKVEARVRGAAAWTPFVDAIEYDAKGQREKIVYAGGATFTEYEYDDTTFRLKQLVTKRLAGNKTLQDLSYTYDPVGNITEIRDAAHQEVFFANDVALPKMAYVYDALYRLTEATGREHAAMGATMPSNQDEAPFGLPHANDVNAVRNYRESYAYDAVGNILEMIHASGAAATSWTRRCDVSTTSNRLLRTSVADDLPTQFSAQYGYDVHGNMTSMPHLAAIGWNYRDEMVSADKGGGGMVYFTYDASGERVRKVYVHSGLIEERIYLGGWEIYRKRLVSAPDEIVLERETLHMMDGVRRIAMVETKTVDADVGGAFQPSTVTRFQMGNHLGSATLEVDAAGLVISYEEYHPYGTTAYQSATSAVEVSRKRYKYTGKERDEETGLYYHGARYYAPWLGRWTAADPAGLVDGPGRYTYVRGNPITFTDPRGLAVFLEGMNETQRGQALAKLQSLTNEILGIERIEEKSGGGCVTQSVTTRFKVVAIGMQQELDLAKGTELLRGLIASDKEILIKQGVEDETDPFNRAEAIKNRQGKNGKGSGSIVTFDFNRVDDDEYWVGDSAARDAKWEQGRRYISLGHELIHAERYARGVAATTESLIENRNNPMRGKKGPEGQSFWTREAPEELETIGAEGFGSRITENDLRREHGMNDRLSHTQRRRKK